MSTTGYCYEATPEMYYPCKKLGGVWIGPNITASNNNDEDVRRKMSGSEQLKKFVGIQFEQQAKGPDRVIENSGTLGLGLLFRSIVV